MHDLGHRGTALPLVCPARPHPDDTQRGAVDTQLIAHDKEVYDIAWGGAGVFASVSADGSVRVFDLRDKEHSTIIYETEQPNMPLLRLAWNKQVPTVCAKQCVLTVRVQQAHQLHDTFQ